MDLVIVEGPGKGAKSLTIYELEPDRLKICGTLFDAPGERPTEFAAGTGSGRILLGCEREKK
jgi:uncharacterized protein (TIGR03067 family)